MCQKLSNIKNKKYWVIHVTANKRDSSIETGSKTMMTTASLRFPNAAAQAAFMTMSDITPLFTALPIRGPSGFSMALNNGVKIIIANKVIKGSVCKKCSEL